MAAISPMWQWHTGSHC